MDVKKLSQVLTVACGLIGGALLVPTLSQAAPDPNFHIYIAYGQSNMEGNATNFTDVDKKEHPRVKMFATTECSNLGRPTVGEVYPAIPPMFKCNQGLSVADWFGRHMADSLPDITIGIIPVAVGGTSIRLFDPDDYKAYLSTAESWLQNSAKAYGNDGNAMKRIIDVAKKAQEKGVIKGIIFHQGETDGGMGQGVWEGKVKKTYEYMLTQLGLNAEETPFVAGEMVDGGSCAGFSSRVRGLSNYIANFGVASSAGYGSKGDGLHFTVEGYRGMGERYAQQMLKLINVEPVEPEPQTPFGGTVVELPGKIEAENFDVPGKGSGNDSYKENDSDDHGAESNGGKSYREGTGVDIYKKATGYVVGYNQEGEWLEYTVNVKEAGDYTMFAAVATDNATSAFQLSIDGENITDALLASKTDVAGTFDDFSKVQANVTLPAGEHILRMTVTASWFDVDYFTFVKGKDATDPDEPPSFVKPAFVSHATETESNFAVVDLQGRVIFSMQAKNMNEAVAKVKNSVMHNIASKGVYFVVSNPGTSKQQMKKVVINEK